MINLIELFKENPVIKGHWAFALGEKPARAIAEFARHVDGVALNSDINPTNLGIEFSESLNAQVQTKLSGFLYSGRIDRRSVMTLLSHVKVHLDDKAIIVIDNADAMSAYEAIRESMLADRSLYFDQLQIDTEDSRPGRGIAILSYDSSRSEFQPPESIPANKNRDKAHSFKDAKEVLSNSKATAAVTEALARWEAASETEAANWQKTMEAEHPDQSSPTGYWHENSEEDFVDFFTWGHDHHFGYDYRRQGAMSTRHIEIVAECLEYGFLEQNLSGKDILNVGCWTGGDLLALAGMGARVTAIEEHKGSAAAASRLCQLVGAEATVTSDSLYAEKRDWVQRFDVVYISGVIYHVTDPLLALRICFAYLKPGGRIIVETKASSLNDNYCEYAGTLEKGWNWYAPTRDALGRWLSDAGFPLSGIELLVRPNGRLLAAAAKEKPARLPEKSGFSRPGSWLEDVI